MPMLVFAHGIVGRADLPIPASCSASPPPRCSSCRSLALAAGWSRPRLERVRERPLVRVPARGRGRARARSACSPSRSSSTPGSPARTSRQDNLAPDRRLRRLLGRDPVRLAAARRRLPAAEPVARARARRRLGRARASRGGAAAGAAALSRAPGPLAGGRGHRRLRRSASCAGRRAASPGRSRCSTLVYTAVQFVGHEPRTASSRGRAAGTPSASTSACSRASPPLGRRADGRLVLRPPLAARRLGAAAGHGGAAARRHRLTAFDGAKEGPLFQDVAPDLQDFFAGLGALEGPRARARVRGRAGRRRSRSSPRSGGSAWRACRGGLASAAPSSARALRRTR